MPDKPTMWLYMPKFTAVNKHGYRTVLRLLSKTRDGEPYFTTGMAGAYVADLETGQLDGLDGCRGCTLQLVPNAIKRLRAHCKTRENRGDVSDG